MIDLKKMTDEELQNLHLAVSNEKIRREKTKKLAGVSKNLTTFEAHQDMLSDMITDNWDAVKEEALVDSLLANAGNAPSANDEIADIMETAGTASNAREDLQSSDDEDEDYGEIEEIYEQAYEAAMKKLEAFWNVHVKKPSK